MITVARFTPLAQVADGPSLTAVVLVGLLVAAVLCLIPVAVQIDAWLAARRPRCRRGESNRQIDRWTDEDAPRESEPT